MRFAHEFAAYQPMVQLWLHAFPVVGLVLLLGIGLLCAELLRACRMRLRAYPPVPSQDQAAPPPTLDGSATAVIAAAVPPPDAA